MNPSLLKRSAAELIGTFVLVFGGCGAAVLAGDKIGFAGISLAFGFSLLAMVYAIGPISGCHINPAVTLGLVMAKKFKPAYVLPYVLAQTIGAVLAAGLLLVILKDTPAGYDPVLSGLAANGYGAHSPGHYGALSAFLLEVILTFFLVLTVLGATDIKAPAGFAGLPIGFVLVLIHLVGIPVTNTSVNPVRSLGPALFVGGWVVSQLWLFVVAPLAGALLASLAYLGVRQAEPLISAQLAEQALLSHQEQLKNAPTPL